MKRDPDLDIAADLRIAADSPHTQRDHAALFYEAAVAIEALVRRCGRPRSKPREPNPPMRIYTIASET